MRALVYSSIYGGYDDLKEQAEQTVKTDFLMIGDDIGRYGTTSDWTMIDPSYFGYDDILFNLPNNRMRAKYWKLHPNEAHELMSGALGGKYDLVIWIDGSVKITDPEFVEKCAEWIGDKQMLLFKHPDRSCIYDEAEKTLELPEKYASHDTIGQIRAYRDDGMPEEAGLWACTVIVRKGDTSKFDDAWWQENLKWGYQDQISFAYLVHKMGITPAEFPFYQYRNQYLDCSGMNKHASNK